MVTWSSRCFKSRCQTPRVTRVRFGEVPLGGALLQVGLLPAAWIADFGFVREGRRSCSSWAAGPFLLSRRPILPLMGFTSFGRG